MKNTPRVIIIVLLGLLYGCQSVDEQAGFARIRAGQTVAQVEQQLGKADQQTDEALVYVEPAYRVVIPLHNGRVAREPAYVAAQRPDCHLKATTD